MNRIALENQMDGAPSSEWDLNGADNGTIEGFATEISVNAGETVVFKVRTAADTYRIDIYRLGYYRGLGARKVGSATLVSPLPEQPEGVFDATTGLLDCGNWSVSASWPVYPDAVSGIYIAKLVRQDDEPGAAHIVFIVRNDQQTADLLFQASDTTWQAYNDYGGYSLYKGADRLRAYKVSYNRPFSTRSVEEGANWLFNGDYAMVRWLERNGYDVTYCAAADVERSAVLQRHRVFLSVGHDEDWFADQRAAVTAARDRGMHLAFFSGNSVYWKTRWEADADGRPFRILVCYKDGAAKLDPVAWTGLWRDPRVGVAAGGAHPENALTGVLSGVAGFTSNAITVPGIKAPLRFWRNTAVARLLPDGKETLTSGTLGYEWDQDKDNGHRPPGLVHLSAHTIHTDVLLVDDDGTFGSGDATHNLVFYRHKSGALVFSAATVQWSWGLDDTHDTPNDVAAGPPDDCIRQATVNLLADMGVQPTTLQPWLVAAEPSTDVTPPSSAFTTLGWGRDPCARGGVFGSR